MLTLSTADVRFSESFNLLEGPYLISRNPKRSDESTNRQLLVIDPTILAETIGFCGYVSFGKSTNGLPNTILLPSSLSYLDEGDVVLLNPNNKSLRTIYRRSSPNNSFLLTERCNHYCVMCSQPPRIEDDGYLAEELLKCIPLVDKQTVEIGFTGGEPTLLGDMFFHLVEASKTHLPNTSLHVLTNGRRFVDFNFADKLGRIGHHDLMLGVPLYSDEAEIHNFVVQASRALDETLNGIINLKAVGVKVEIRVVLHRYTIPTLVSLANFITKNLLFVDHVAFMGLEAMGFAKTNWTDLWIDPQTYQNELVEAATLCSARGLNVSVYNLPLCWIDPRLGRFYRRSISDWKNEYDEECQNCSAMNQCGGFFSSNVRAGMSKGVRRLSSDNLRRFNETVSST